MAASKSTFLIYFDYFRAIAILLVVVGHCYGDWSRDTLTEIAASNVITGGTALFVFVSGFFFQHLFDHKFRYMLFLRKKAVKVLLPYLLLSTAYLALAYTLDGMSAAADGTADATGNSAATFLFDLLTGARITAYWYVPFAMLVFIASPVFRKVIRWEDRWVVGLLVAGFVVSVFVQRPAQNLSPLHSFAYFCPFYLFGMYYCKRAGAINSWIDQRLALLILLLIALDVFMSAQGQLGNMIKPSAWSWAGPDYMVPQKVLLILVLIGLTRKLERFDLPWLRFIAQISFGIFFIHPWALALQDRLIGARYTDLTGFAFRVVFVLAVTILSILATRALLGRRSAYVIGA